MWSFKASSVCSHTVFPSKTGSHSCFISSLLQCSVPANLVICWYSKWDLGQGRGYRWCDRSWGSNSFPKADSKYTAAILSSEQGPHSLPLFLEAPPRIPTYWNQAQHFEFMLYCLLFQGVFPCFPYLMLSHIFLHLHFCISLVAFISAQHVIIISNFPWVIVYLYLFYTPCPLLHIAHAYSTGLVKVVELNSFKFKDMLQTQ